MGAAGRSLVGCWAGASCFLGRVWVGYTAHGAWAAAWEPLRAAGAAAVLMIGLAAIASGAVGAAGRGTVALWDGVSGRSRRSSMRYVALGTSAAAPTAGTHARLTSRRLRIKIQKFDVFGEQNANRTRGKASYLCLGFRPRPRCIQWAMRTRPTSPWGRYSQPTQRNHRSHSGVRHKCSRRRKSSFRL